MIIVISLQDKHNSNAMKNIYCYVPLLQKEGDSTGARTMWLTIESAQYTIVVQYLKI
jgi:hypothetical protein